MKTREGIDFENKFQTELINYLKKKHNNLVVVSELWHNSYHEPMPDVIVKNPTTGRSVLIDLFWSKNGTVPFAKIPMLKAMKKAHGDLGAHVWFVCNAGIENNLKQWLEEAEIGFAEGSDALQVVEMMEDEFKRLDSPVNAEGV